MAKIRINELARELELKSDVVLEYLAELGIPDKRSSSSALDEELADKVREHFRLEVRMGGSGDAIWINQLAHELTVKSGVILHYLAESGIAEGKSKTIILTGEIANKVREHFRAENQRKGGEATSKAGAK